MGRGFAGGDFPQRLGQLRGGGGQYGGAHRPVSAPAGQGVGQIRRRQLGSLGVDPIGQPRGGLPQRVLRAGRQREQQRAVDTGCGRGVAWCTGFGAGTGACSTMACTLVPVMPYDDTAARRGVSDRRRATA